MKSAFDAIVNRARAEKVWSSRVTFAHPKIGWVRGTGSMAGNDPLVEVVERHGLKTYSTAEIAVELLNLSTRESRIEAAKAPLDVDLTGGLGNEPIDIKALRAEAMEDAVQAEAANAKNAIAGNESDIAAKTLIKALPSPRAPRQAKVDLAELAERQRMSGRRNRHRVRGRTWTVGLRYVPTFEAELGIHSDGQVDLSAGAVLELAWNMGLLTWNDSPKPGWYDVDGNLVPERISRNATMAKVVARSGVRPFDEGMGNDYKDGADEEEAEVFLDHDVTFSVPTREIAEEYVKLDETHTSFAADVESGEWNVTAMLAP